MAEIEPQTLKFVRPFKQGARELINIKNLNKEVLAFKVKTTAPSTYSVRPNSGLVQPGQAIQIAIQLKPMDEPPAGAKCTDKFLVQTLVVPENYETYNFLNIWTEAEKLGWKIQDKKLHCEYIDLQVEHNDKFPLVSSASSLLGKQLANTDAGLQSDLLLAHSTIAQLLMANSELRQERAKSNSDNHPQPATQEVQQKGQSSSDFLSFVLAIIVAIIGLAIGYYTKSYQE